MKEARYGGLTSMLVKKVMAELGIEQKTVDKIQSVVDNVDIREDGEQTIIEIKLNNIKILTYYHQNQYYMFVMLMKMTLLLEILLLNPYMKRLKMKIAKL